MKLGFLSNIIYMPIIIADTFRKISLLYQINIKSKAITISNG